MAKIDFAKLLNREQHAAATAPDGPLLILAAAGTGKTRTLVYRVAYLVEHGISPYRILLLTFTNRAAREMLDRAQQLIGTAMGSVWGGTFHHMANRILRRHADKIGYRPDYTILDRDDSRTLVLNCIKERHLQSRDFPKPDVLLGMVAVSANTETPLERIVQDRFAEYETDPETVIRLIRDYQERKHKLNAMDFDDLLVNCLRLFNEKDSILEKYREQFLHVLVDEYQDTNSIQAKLVDRISEKNRNLFVVGDDFQSIYSWRGSDLMNIMSFPEHYTNTKIYKLETNYRSVPEILEVANACIAGNPDQFQKVLRPTRDPYKKPMVTRLRDSDEQARYVLVHIHHLRRSGYRLSDIAVLYRAHYHAMELQMLLTRERIPYVITSGMRFFEQAHIKDVCSVLRILENPEDELAFTRLLRLLPGVGARTASKIWIQLGSRFDACDSAQRSGLKQSLRKTARASWTDIEAVFIAYKQEDLHEDGGELIHRFLKVFYQQYAVNTYENCERRLDDIRELILYMAKFESVEQFLCDVALLTNLDAEVENLNISTTDTLRLSTVHQAKGMEWSAVILLWMADGMFPSARSMKESPLGESEERRLFYVAVTRAKDELMMCVPEVRRTRDGGIMYCPPSRFVEEIPKELLDERRGTGFE